ncbi:MAG: cupin-like domain-containing protein [Nostoc sp. DedQUE12b]|uniref:cupin-like domain-containing protein n=1 Tax=Nostoc sp. DedQUE12b TaxID=3075398 RepID=UPI002AD57E75|nr:cupin-like domain-containing protein [Nostoc sp. DedQUE12b]MDZ8084251.1 cupin-like domain-containing protein [Nostoc sp. DedQUE12b]
METQSNKSILKIKNPSTEKFLDIWKQYQPFLIEDVAEHWDACHKWSNDYLIEHCGNKVVYIWFFQKNFLYDYKKFAYDNDSYYIKEMQYKEYVKDIEERANGNNNDDIGCYSNEIDFEDRFPELVGDVTYPKYLDRKPWVNLWHGFSNKNFTSASTLHFDRVHNIYAQIRGRKRFLLFPPSNYLSFYPPLNESSGIGHNSKVNPDLLQLELFPKFPWQQRIEVILQPGEILYIPPFWWHHVTAIDENISLSFWYDLKIQDFFKQKNMLQVVLNIAPPYLRHVISGGSLKDTIDLFKGLIS